MLHNGNLGADKFTFTNKRGKSVVDYIISDNIMSMGSKW